MAVLLIPDIRLSIKCPRCGAINQVKAASPESERHGASVRKGTLRGNQESET
ncbi:MAG: Com family DNA-binding transcriptional regulator [Alcanivorax sp.]|nr:Com family DNA-binding transcriptional regulator [Alcanivorax sp.]